MCDRHYAVCRVECLHSRSCVLKVQHFEQNVSIRALWGEIIISFIVYTRNVLWHCNNGKKKIPTSNLGADVSPVSMCSRLTM